jgi:formylglycine-generating enzyme required for sulfatase activity
VTRGEFAKFTHKTGHASDLPCPFVQPRHSRDWGPGEKQEDRYPMICITWADANAYIGWLNRQNRSSGGVANAGMYRLPTEAEYEYAARGGTTTKRWWGDDIGRNKAVCVDCGSPWSGTGPAPVGLYGANPYGVYDILGNVWEWLQDCWNDTYERAPTDGSAWLTGDCKLRVARGGSWQSGADSARPDARFRFDQDASYMGLGFRVAKSLQ